jgi:hypothetical protein
MPFRKIDFSNAKDVALYEDIGGAVQQLLKTESKLSTAASSADQTRYDGIVKQLRRRIDQDIERLYDLDKFERQPWNEWKPLPGRRARKNSGRKEIELLDAD